MKRLILILSGLIVLIPVTLLTWLLTTESGLHWAFQQSRGYLPPELALGEIKGKLLGPITIKGLEYKHQSAQIQTGQLIIDWQPSALLLAHINISQLHIQALKVILPESEKNNAALSLPEINLPWRTALNNVRIDGLHLQQNEQSLKLNQLGLSVTSLFNQLDIEQLYISADNFNINIFGELRASGKYRHKLQVQWQTTLPSKAVISSSGQLAGNLKTTHIKQHLSGALQLKLDGKVNDLLNQISWQANVDVNSFDFAQLITDGPALTGKLKLQAKGDLNTALVSGDLNGNYSNIGPFETRFELQRNIDNSLQINRLLLQTPLSEARINAHGKWNPGSHGGYIKLALDWQKLRWPLTDQAWFNTAQGSGEIEGNLEKYTLKVRTDSPWPQVPEATLQASAEGNLDGLKLQSLSFITPRGKVNANGQLNWSPQLNWQAQVKATDIDPAVMWPQWPGKLQAKLLSRGRLENGKLIADTDIVHIKGDLRGYPLSATSRSSWNNSALDISQLDLQSGASHFSARGHVGESLNLDWSLSSGNLGELYPQAQGQLNSSGHLNGPIKTPLINAAFSGKALSLPGYKIGMLDANLTLDTSLWQQIDIRLTAQSLNFNEHTLKALDITAVTEKIQAQLSTELASANITLQGKANTRGWRGKIERADITSALYGNWQLKAPAPILLGENTIKADSFCLQNPRQQASLCTSLHREKNHWQSQIDMQQFPLRLINPLLASSFPADLKLEGLTSGSANLQLLAPDQLLGHAHLDFPPGVISYPLIEGERDTWEYKNSSLSISLNEQGINAKSDFTMTNGDRLSVSAELPGAQLLKLNSEKQNLRAQAILTIHDLGLIEAFVPEVQDLKGELSLNLSASGTLAKPRLSGHAQLLNGAVRVPRLGLNINQFSANAHSDGQEQIKLSLNAHSDEGEITIKGKTELNKNAGWPTEVSIKGEQFEAVKIPDARVMISPDLKIKLQHYNIFISGNVDIPDAKLQPKDITTAAQVSDDAVIVGGEQAVQQKWSVTSRVRLTLGERVNFYGFGFEGRLGGSLLVEDIPGQLTRATGEINIPEGRYRAYGQRLDVEHGRMLFTGGPLTNPGLDVRAVRKINTITAGVKVRGSLKQPQLELFSIPVMGQTDTLSYLLLGRPMETASGEEGAMMAKAALALSLSGGDYLARTIGEQFGLDEMRVESSDTGDQASLVVGRYLSPKIYVSYGVGLIETINTFTVRYKISDKWQIKAESGEAQGADILYTIER